MVSVEWSRGEQGNSLAAHGVFQRMLGIPVGYMDHGQPLGPEGLKYENR